MGLLQKLITRTLTQTVEVERTTVRVTVHQQVQQVVRRNPWQAVQADDVPRFCRNNRVMTAMQVFAWASQQPEGAEMLKTFFADAMEVQKQHPDMIVFYVSQQ